VIEGIREQAATLRLRIESNRIWQPKRPRNMLAASARAVEVLRYRVSRIALLQKSYREAREFPRLTRPLLGPFPKLSAAAHFRQVVVSLFRAPAPQVREFRSDVFAQIDQALQGVRDDFDITSRRADAQLRIIAAVVTILVLLATLVLVVLAARGH